MAPDSPVLQNATWFALSLLVVISALSADLAKVDANRAIAPRGGFQPDRQGLACRAAPADQAARTASTQSQVVEAADKPVSANRWDILAMIASGGCVSRAP